MTLSKLPIAAAVCASLLAGCTTEFQAYDQNEARLTPVQQCAIGYDMSREIFRHVELTETIIIAPDRKSACETYALQYLRQAGFAIDDRGSRHGFDIAVTQSDIGHVDAVATVGGTIKLARSYELAETGVYATSATTLLQLSASARAR